jgi:hypothetical protein
VLANPIADTRETKLLPLHRAVDEIVPLQRIDINVQAVESEEDIRSGERGPLIAVDKAVIVASDSIKAAASSSMDS